MSRMTSHRWGRRINPTLTGTFLSQEAIGRILTPLHMSIKLLPLGLFTKDHAEHVAKIVNLVAADSAGRGDGAWQVADRVGTVLIAMKARADAGKAWNCTTEEREILIENIMKMDRYLRAWTNRRFTQAAMTVDRINAAARAAGGKFMERVEIPTKGCNPIQEPNP